LRAGAKVAAVGGGHGASTILMAQADPESTFVGFDHRPPSIDWARRQADRTALGERARFEVSRATDFPGEAYDSSRCSIVCATWATRLALRRMSCAR